MLGRPLEVTRTQRAAMGWADCVAVKITLPISVDWRPSILKVMFVLAGVPRLDFFGVTVTLVVASRDWSTVAPICTVHPFCQLPDTGIKSTFAARLR